MKGVTYSDEDESEDDLYQSDEEKVVEKKVMDVWLKNKIGEAHDLYTRKEYDRAISVCFEIIEKGHTECLEAYNTWILCSEAQGKEEVALSLRIIKNDIMNKKNRKNSDYSNWLELAEKAENMKDYKWAYLCYVRALRKCKKNRQMHRAKALCCLKLGKTYKYLDIMKHQVLISPLSEEFVPDLVQTANLYKESKKPEMACELLQNAFIEMKSGKVAFQLFKTFSETGRYAEIIKIFNSHNHVLRGTELFPELEILHLIALINTQAKESLIESCLKSVLKSMSPVRITLGAQLAGELLKAKRNKQAKKLYERLAEFPQPPIFPQSIQLLKEMGEYRQALEMVKIWKRSGNPADSAERLKFETEIASIIMSMDGDLKNESSGPEEDLKDGTPSCSSLRGKRQPVRNSSAKKASKKLKIEAGDDEKDDDDDEEDNSIPQAALDGNSGLHVIGTMEKLVEEWNSEKVKGHHRPQMVDSLCKTIDELLSKEARAFVKLLKPSCSKFKVQEGPNIVDEGVSSKLIPKLFLETFYALLEDFESLGFRDSCYKLLQALNTHLKWCKLSYVQDEGTRDLLESLKLRYLVILSERLLHSTAQSEREREELLNVLSELFVNRSDSLRYFALLNLYGGEEKKKYLPSRKLSKLDKASPEGSLQNFFIKMQLASRKLSSDHYKKAIELLEEVKTNIENGIAQEADIGVKVELLHFCLGSAYFQQSFCRTRTDGQKDADMGTGLGYMRRYYTTRVLTRPCEANYNMGRAYHCIGRMCEAMKYYTKSLAVSTSRAVLMMVGQQQCGDEEDNFVQESAYNLALIHQHNGNLETAQKILLTYIQIQ